MIHIGRVLVVVVGISAVGCTASERVSLLDLQDTVIDLGVLDPGESKFDFTFRNGGTAPLVMKQIVSTCSCTQAEATTQVEPGGSGVAWGKINVVSGPGGAVLTFTTNAPGEPRQVRVRWFGKSRPTLVPDKLAVAMKVGADASREVEVSYAAGDPPSPLEFVGATGLPDGVKVELIENNPAAIRAIPGLSASFTTAPSPFVGRAKLRVHLPAPKTPGTAAFECLVRFLQRGRLIEMPLKVSLDSDEGLRCEPQALLFSASDPESLKQVRRSATLTSDRSGDRFKVVEKPAYLNVTLMPKDAGSATRALITASITATPPPGEANPQLVLADATGRQVAVKLYFGGGP